MPCNQHGKLRRRSTARKESLENMEKLRKDLGANSLLSNASNSTDRTSLTALSKTILNLVELLNKFKARGVTHSHITCAEFWKIPTENVCGELHSNLYIP